MNVLLDPNSVDSYRQYLAIKQLPAWSIRGRLATFPDEYADRIGLKPKRAKSSKYTPEPFLFDYQRDIADLAIRRQRFAVFADCLAAEAVINSPDGDITIGEAYRIGKPIKVYAIDNGKVVIAQGSAPFVSGINRLYRFEFASGRTITATMGHRFLSTSGWKRGGELSIGEQLAVSSPSLLRSTLGTCQPESPAGDRRLLQTTPGCRDDYWTDPRQCDGQLRYELSSDRASFPLPADAHERNRTPWRLDDRESISECTHHCQLDGRPSMLDCGCPDESMAASVECQTLSFDPTCTAESIHTSRPTCANTSPGLQVCESHPLADLQSVGVQSEPLLDSLVERDTLVSIHYIRTDVYYDIEVQGPANFLANGVWSHNCGLGKTMILLSYARHVQKQLGKKKRVLIISPPMVVYQTMAEAEKFFGDDIKIDRVKASGLAEWLESTGDAIGITNYEALKETTPKGNLGALILDESSVLKSHYGEYAGICLRLGAGLDWKLCLTGTPAPNDRIEYANHAVFLDRFPTVNSFLATYFINRGQTGERWELKPHGLRPFYRSLSDWCIFLSDPSVYGWKDNVSNIPPIFTHIEHVPMTPEQADWVRKELGVLIAVKTGGITHRAQYGQVAKGNWKGQKIPTLKYEYMADRINSWRAEESTLVWCLYDHEQAACHKAMGGGSLDGKTPLSERRKVVDAFKAREIDTLVSKSKILGFGLNLQVATRQVFSGLQDSYESFYQCVKRSNRIGSTKPLNVHIPATELEMPMIENVLQKAHRVEADTREQEALFLEARG